MRTFSWNKVRYRSDRPLAELIETLQKVKITARVSSQSLPQLAHHAPRRSSSISTTMSRASLTSTTRSRRTWLPCTESKREETTFLEQCAHRSGANESNSGNLTTKSLTPLVDPSLLITDSEYLETHLIVVPANSKKEFLKSYETIAPMVVPRSSVEVTKDEEFVLFAVTTFKKTSAEFLQKCREQKYTPRQYKYVEGGKEEEQKELDRAARDEKKVWGEALRLARTGWSEAVMVWAHVMTLRVFVETVLRYGLPLEYVSGLVKVGQTIPRTATVIHLLLTVFIVDDAQAVQKGQDFAGFCLFVLGRQRFWQGQEGQDHQGRRRHQLGNGSGGPRVWGGQRVHGLCILRV